MPSPLDLAPKLLEYQVYPEPYFAGSDVSIYFGDAWVDEIVSLNFTLLEYVQPVFGYNSYVYDACMRGSRIIQGNFRINFRESYYLHKIIMSDIINGKENSWSRYSRDRVTVEDYIAKRKANEIVSSLGTMTDKDLKDQIESMKMPDLLKVAKRIQDQVWDKKTTAGSTDDDAPFFRHAAKGFTVVIMYGSKLQSVAGVNEYSRKYDLPATTNYTLTGVQLSSLGHVIAPDGTPVYEDYQFIARDLDLGR
jgi:hypothetical protein